MNLSDVIHKQSIIPNIKSVDKMGVLKEMATALSFIVNTEAGTIFDAIWEREQLCSTGIGGGIAFPTGKLTSINSIVVGLGISHQGVYYYNSLDNKPVHIIFLMITPTNPNGDYLRIKAQISKFLNKKNFKESLLKAESVEEIVNIFNSEDKNQFFG
ncbi:MAG: PTS sugar transporter subunit IIA [Desulfamplus sp.]|nr:PTS sugar transporter subunit IIA [Desulfamplus sp.]